MKKVLTVLLILMLSACNSSPNDTMKYDELINAYFDTTEYTVSNDTIKVTIRNDMNYNDMVALGNLMLQEIEGNMTLELYKYNNVIPTVIILTKQDDETTGTVFNKEE